MRLYKDIKRLTALKRSLASDHSESEIQQLFYSIVNNSSNSVVLTNANKDIIYVNPSFEVLSGYTLDEVLGKNPKIIKSNKTPSSVYRDMHQRLRNGLNWKGVFINRHKSGNEYVEEVMIKPIRNDKDEITYYLAEKKDITSFRNSESIIKKLTNFDSLTGLPNRDNFIDYANALTKRTLNNENSFAVIFADLNRFKELNVLATHTKDLMVDTNVAPTEWHFFAGVPVGMGLVDNLALARILDKENFTGFMAVEIDFPHKDWTGLEEEAVRISVKKLRQISNQLLAERNAA